MKVRLAAHGLPALNMDVLNEPQALLIAKERLDFNNIIGRTGGIVFLGCLHDESSPLAEMIALKCAAVEFGTNLKHAAIDALNRYPVSPLDWPKPETHYVSNSNS
jgi:hypothetical protein